MQIPYTMWTEWHVIDVQNYTQCTHPDIKIPAPLNGTIISLEQTLHTTHLIQTPNVSRSGGNRPEVTQFFRQCSSHTHKNGIMTNIFFCCVFKYNCVVLRRFSHLWFPIEYCLFCGRMQLLLQLIHFPLDFDIKWPHSTTFSPGELVTT